MIRKLFTLISELDTTKALLGLRFDGYLHELGWFNAFTKKMPIGNNFEPLPWVTYPFIDFLEPRLTNQMDVFEYGAGNSTFYYAAKVRSVTSVEHDEEWFKNLLKSKPSNAELLYQKLEYGGLYAETALQTGKTYDIIIVDGRDRVNCSVKSVAALKQSGVLVLDDSERKEYLAARKFFESNNFKSLDFWGIAPGLAYKKCTTIFYRENNCLGI